MDTVEGKKDGKVLLTMLFRNSKLMLAFLLEDKTRNSVLKVFNWLESTQQDIDLLINHINSLTRPSLNNATSYDLAEILLDKEILKKLNLKRIAANEIQLKPNLLKKN